MQFKLEIDLHANSRAAGFPWFAPTSIYGWSHHHESEYQKMIFYRFCNHTNQTSSSSKQNLFSATFQKCNETLWGGLLLDTWRLSRCSHPFEKCPHVQWQNLRCTYVHWLSSYSVLSWKKVHFRACKQALCLPFHKKDESKICFFLSTMQCWKVDCRSSLAMSKKWWSWLLIMHDEAS